MAHAAVRELPVPASATALQPEIEVPPSVKFTIPVGVVPVTVAVKVVFEPTVDPLGVMEAAPKDGAVVTCG